MGKSFKLGMLICQPSQKTDPISVCGRYQTGRQFLDHVYLRCTQRECRISDDIVANCWSQRTTTYQSLIANLRIKRVNKFFKVTTPCLDDHQLAEEEHESVR